jgi:hypothetical protein
MGLKDTVSDTEAVQIEEKMNVEGAQGVHTQAREVKA